jgi:hypothetical protein
MTPNQLYQRDLRDLELIMCQPEGRRLISRILGLSGVFRLSYEKGDTHETAFREGQRNIGNILFSDIVGIEDYAAALAQGEHEREVTEEDG